MEKTFHFDLAFFAFDYSKLLHSEVEYKKRTGIHHREDRNKERIHG